MKVIKGVIIVFWALVVWNLISPFPPPYSNITYFAALALLGMHAFEVMSFSAMIRATSQDVRKDVAFIMLFGIFHLMQMKREHQAKLAREEQRAQAREEDQ